MDQNKKVTVNLEFSETMWHKAIEVSPHSPQDMAEYFECPLDTVKGWIAGKPLTGKYAVTAQMLATMCVLTDTLPTQWYGGLVVVMDEGY